MNVGDHIRNRKVKGAVWQITGHTRKHLLVRCLETGVPALISRKELDRWHCVFTCRPGLEGLEKKGAMLVRTDAPKPRVSLAGVTGPERKGSSSE
jgi:hypothetical protein